MLALSITSTQRVLYVKPDDSASSNCPDQPCLCLDQYAENPQKYFTKGAIFLFLAGTHILQTTINLVNVTDITLKGMKNDSDIDIRSEVAIQCENLTNLIIERLTFILLSSISGGSSSALSIMSSKKVFFHNLAFQGSGNPSKVLVRAIYSAHSDITIVRCLFKGNTGDYGGAIVALTSNLTLNGNRFIKNIATGKGGAIFANKSYLILEETLGNIFVFNSATDSGGALHLQDSSVETISGDTNITATMAKNLTISKTVPKPLSTYFLDNTANQGGGICLHNSICSWTGTLVFFENNSAVDGGALYNSRSVVISTTKELYLIGNEAERNGGAYFGIGGTLTLGEATKNYSSHNFSGNSGGHRGGAIYCESEELKIAGSSYFRGNNIRSSNSYGGAILIVKSNCILSSETSFISNHAQYGGAFAFIYSHVIFKATVLTFLNNSADGGGGILCYHSHFVAQVKVLHFISNSATEQGGGIWSDGTTDHDFRVASATFVNNRAGCGGAIGVYTGTVVYHDLTAIGNSESAVCIVEGTALFSGYTKIAQNIGNLGGGVRSERSDIFFTDYSVLENNCGNSGGAINGFYGTTFHFDGVTIFIHNTAVIDGGAIYISDSHITFKQTVNFTSNSAQNGSGGAMYLHSDTTLTLEPPSYLTTSHNYANEFGGAIYHEDNITPIQCKFEMGELQTLIVYLPHCFINMKDLIYRNYSFAVDSYYDTAGKGGSFLYGGLLDKCQIYIRTGRTKINSVVLYDLVQNSGIFLIEADENMTKADIITSEPYKLCFCKIGSEYINCSEVKEIDIYRGQKFSLSLSAVAQGGALVPTLVTAKISSTARLKLNQSSQSLNNYCTDLVYNLYSTQDSEELILYLDGPCRDTGLARAVVKVTFLRCPDAFVLSEEKCKCEERLRKYNAKCIVDEEVYIVRKHGSRFWMSALVVDKTYQGLILYRSCPIEYCQTETVKITLDNPDIQCEQNRRGVLCGACTANHSLLFGSSQCQICSNIYLTLLLPFAAAGIVLVVFLSVLRLTVATGTVNIFILYANIVQANRNLFLPTHSINVLTVFIAWLNLDLGFPTCFYHGMDAYAQTWLQFAFPIYVWIIVSVIILTSRYSMTVTKVIGSNPIAVLSTLLLMSYTKILKIVIEVYSSVNLDYPGNKTVTVWLKDANVSYLQSKHLVLTVVTTLVLVFLFLPYTFFLLMGYKLYFFSNWKYLNWINRIKPLLDSYYAPYKIHSRYWTGFLLLIRCTLYLIFSFDSLGSTTKSLLAIILTFSAIGIGSRYLATGNVYCKYYNNVIEASVFLNLITLSAVTLINANSPELVYSLVGIVFATMIGTIVYHFHFLYFAKSPIWLKISTKLLSYKERTIPAESSNTEVTSLLSPTTY